MKKKKNFGFATKTIHSGASPEAITGARNVPIYQTTSFVFDNTEHAKRLFNLQDFGFIYSMNSICAYSCHISRDWNEY